MFTTLSRVIFRPAIVLSLAASIALSPVSATSAEAHGSARGNDAFVAALVALGLIGIIASNNNGQHSNQYQVPRAKRLPEQCLKTFRTRRGNRTAFGKPCLRNNFNFWRRLPDQCETRIRIRNNQHRWVWRRVFEPRCLENAGYRIVYDR